MITEVILVSHEFQNEYLNSLMLYIKEKIFHFISDMQIMFQLMLRCWFKKIMIWSLQK